jgi:signal transduction histidine kinase
MNMHDLIVRTIDHGTEVRMDPAAAGVHVLADVTQLEMAVLNLAINARDAMGDGGALTIATRSRILSGRADVSDGRYVEISLTDQGSGMPRETARRAFEPFFTTKPIGKGTGLGLSQVYSMATRAGGTARIKSAEGKVLRCRYSCLW